MDKLLLAFTFIVAGPIILLSMLPALVAGVFLVPVALLAVMMRTTGVAPVVQVPRELERRASTARRRFSPNLGTTG